MVIASDFDGTLCEHKYPEIGKPNVVLINKLISLQKEGHQLILWTCREGSDLRKAIVWSASQGLLFDAINENILEYKYKDFAIRKIYADVYLDDRNRDIGEFCWGGE
jgi:trehalose-6-phosphatase